MVLLGALTSLLAQAPARGQEIGYRSQEVGAAQARQSSYTPGQSPISTARHLDADLVLEELYDSNVSRSNGAVTQSRGLKAQDEIFMPAITIDALLPVGRESLFLQGGAGYDDHAQNPRLDRERISLDGGANAALGPCRENVTDRYNRNQRGLGSITSLKRVKSTISLETLEATASCGRGEGFVPSLGVSEDWSSNSGALFRTQDYHTLGVDGSLGYARPALGQVALFGAYRDTVFPNALFLGLFPVKQGYHLYSAGISFDHRVGTLIQTSLSISYTSLQPVLSSSRPFSGLTYAVEADYRPTSMLGAHLELRRATLPSNRVGALYSLENIYLGDLNYKLGPRLNLTLGASYKKRDFAAATGSAVGILNETDYEGFAVANYQIGRRWALSLDVRRIQRDANPSTFSYGGTRIALTATARI